MDGLARVIHHLTQATEALKAHAQSSGAGHTDPRLARRLAAQGRRGDTMLAHINPREAQKLERDGGAGTINPRTGLPEFYDTDSSGANMGGGADQGFGGGDSSGAGAGNAGGAAGPSGLGDSGGLVGGLSTSGVGPGLGIDVGITGSPSTLGDSLDGITGAAPTGSSSGYGLKDALGLLSNAYSAVTGSLTPSAPIGGLIGVGKNIASGAPMQGSTMMGLMSALGGPATALGYGVTQGLEALGINPSGPQGGYADMSNDAANQGIDPAVLAAINGTASPANTTPGTAAAPAAVATPSNLYTTPANALPVAAAVPAPFNNAYTTPAAGSTVPAVGAPSPYNNPSLFGGLG